MRSDTVKLVLATALTAGLACGAPLSAKAGLVTLTFDEYQDGESILSGYDGGAGSAGGAGPDVGVNLPSASAIAFGASGNFSGNPSPPNVLGFDGSGPFIMTVADGFSGSLSFSYASEACFAATFYSAACSGTNATDAYVELLGADGDPLAITSGTPNSATPDSYDLADNYDTSDSSLDVFSLATIDFSGVADAVEFFNVTDPFGGAATYVDNVSYVPEPASVSLFLFGLGALGVIRRRA